LACEYACKVLHIYEAECPIDNRSRVTVETSALYADGLATGLELKNVRRGAKVAQSDARDAALEEGEPATDWADAVMFAAGAAYGSAYEVTFGAAAGADQVAVWSSRSALSAARAAVAATGGDVKAAESAGKAARRSEREWQEQRLREICAMGGYPKLEEVC
jgi:hypothetical protein